MNYLAAENRYTPMPYRRCGRSGLMLPAVSLGLWHNFGHVDRFDTARAVVRHAFDHGITHFDLANNYGPPPGSAESVFGDILKRDFGPYRDELIISSKAGYRMGPGPYGEWGSRKNLISSLDQSLKRLGLDYVDIFYSHRPDPDTPLEETMGALDHAVRSGRALYVGVSNYPPQMLREASAILRQLGTPCLIHQPRYNLFDRQIEGGLLDALRDEGVGCIAFSPLAQGLLTDKYLGGIPGRFTRRQECRLPDTERRDAGASGHHHAAERHRLGTWPEALADGALVGAAASRHDVRADRRQPHQPDRRRGRGGAEARLQRRRVRRDRAGPASVGDRLLLQRGEGVKPASSAWAAPRCPGTRWR